MRWGGSVCFCIFGNLSQSEQVKDLLKSGHICQVIVKIKVALCYLGHGVESLGYICVADNVFAFTYCVWKPRKRINNPVKSRQKTDFSIKMARSFKVTHFRVIGNPIRYFMSLCSRIMLALALKVLKIRRPKWLKIAFLMTLLSFEAPLPWNPHEPYTVWKSSPWLHFCRW